MRALFVTGYLLEGPDLLTATRAGQAEEEWTGGYWQFLPAD